MKMLIFERESILAKTYNVRNSPVGIINNFIIIESKRCSCEYTNEYGNQDHWSGVHELYTYFKIVNIIINIVSDKNDKFSLTQVGTAINTRHQASNTSYHHHHHHHWSPSPLGSIYISSKQKS